MGALLSFLDPGVEGNAWRSTVCVKHCDRNLHTLYTLSLFNLREGQQRRSPFDRPGRDLEGTAYDNAVCICSGWGCV